MKTQIETWDSHIPLTIENIRALHSPPENFRISRNEYLANTSFSGSMRKGRCYVLQGACRYKFEQAELEMVTGEFIDFEEGSYSFEVTGDNLAIVVLVWDISNYHRNCET